MLWYGPWDSLQHAGLPWEWQVLVSAWKLRASTKFPPILECYKKVCPHTADQLAHVTTGGLLGGQAAGSAMPWLCEWHQPLALLWGVRTAESVGMTMALALSTRGTHTLALTSPSIPVLSHTGPHTGVPSCLLREEQTLTCEAEFALKIVIVPEGMNPTLFFHFPAVLLFFFHLVPH